MGGIRQKPNDRDLGPGGAGNPGSRRSGRLLAPSPPPTRGLGDRKPPPRNARAAVPTVTCKLPPPSADALCLVILESFTKYCLGDLLQEFILNQDWNDPKSQLQQCCLTLRTEGKEPDIPLYK